MEHRWINRYPAIVDVQLYQHDRPVARCKARDVGIEGMFVDTGPLLYRANTLLEVEFEVELNRRFHRSRSYRLPVIVVHHANEGIGLMILKADVEARYAWQHVMTRARHQLNKAV